VPTRIKSVGRANPVGRSGPTLHARARVDRRRCQHHDPLRKGLGVEAIDRDGPGCTVKEIAPEDPEYAATCLEGDETKRNR